ncbi:hypothetical protein GpartN1_g7084.t1 [Galdieria partita]|uniref:Ima1 N-terminal domain-containing protein n=1 Tax=Galdieria partita TaxID=83374 RepID=A0A9C7UTW1_9RHOD|nr:hypothetical protein GpartN1_g7084.t1 [Galdieria partita]
MKWRRYSSKSNHIYCYFCLQKTAIDPDTLICPDCEQYNGWDENSSFLAVNQPQKQSLHPKRYCVPLKPANPIRGSFLCSECSQKQELWRKAIANIDSCLDAEPSDEMQFTPREKRELERIEQSYGLCHLCKAAVRQRLSWMDQKLSSQWLNFHMARSFIPPSTLTRKEKKGRSQPLFVYLMFICLFLLGLSPFYNLSSNILLGGLVKCIILYSIYKSLTSTLLYPYLFCYCIVSSFVLCGNEWWSSRTWLMIYQIWIGGLYLLLWKRKSTATNKQSLQHSSINLSDNLVTNRLYPLPRALSTLSLEEATSMDTPTRKSSTRGDESHSSYSSARRLYSIIFICKDWKNKYLFQYYPMRSMLVFLFFIIRILVLIYLASGTLIEGCLKVTSWMIVLFIWLHPYTQFIHCYQQMVYQTSYHPFDSKLYQQWKHPLRNSFLFHLLQCVLMAYFMVNLFWRDISPWVERVTNHLFLIYLNTFKQLVDLLFQEWSIPLSILMWMVVRTTQCIWRQKKK